MILPPAEEMKGEAFRLFEDGRYQESLAACYRLLEVKKDPALEVLAATNLYYTGRYEDAEVFFRDLAVRMPDSSYVHSYLAKVLEARGDEGATAEYAAAARLDPGNQDALHSYAGYLLSRKDYRGALPVLRRLVGMGKTEDDIHNLMRALIAIGRGDEALATHKQHGVGDAGSTEYIGALLQTEAFREAAESALALWRTTGDPAVLRIYLDARSRYDLPGALDAYALQLEDRPDTAIHYDYVLLLNASGRTADALKEAVRLSAVCPSRPEYRLAVCDLLAATGDTAASLEKYERLVKDELAAKEDLEMLGRVVSGYRRFLTRTLPEGEAERRFLHSVSHDPNVVSLLETARFYEETGKPAEARSWYYRAYRADFLAGGPDYALFLAANGEDRECEKVMLYILSNIKKGSDLARVASFIVEEGGRMHTMKRLMDHLIKKLNSQMASLTTEGKDLLAIAFFLSASNALEAADYPGCKFLCLSGMDVMPAHAGAIHLEDYLDLLRRCKELALADSPVLQEQPVAEKRVFVPSPAHEPETERLDLSEQEQKIVSFLRLHRKASEMELRTLLGTRRVAGVVNRLVQKAALQGMNLIAKSGMGEDGEVYEYIGS